MVDITTPTTAAALDQVRSLMRAFVAWHKAYHREDAHLIDRYFDPVAFEEELASLPGPYSPPAGALLLATEDGHPVGCVALRRVDAHTCEMKRMFVRPECQGKGVGRALSHAVIERGGTLGYRSMVLDTSIRQAEAQALYQRCGFRIIPPYYDLPGDLREWLVFMERPLP